MTGIQMRMLLLAGCVVLFIAQPARAGTLSSCGTVGPAISCTGTLDTPEDVFLETFWLTGNEFVEIQTYGFGGGTNAAGATIPSGGFDSLVALFSGPASNATVLTDGSGNPIASADSLLPFSAGCGPAGTVTVGTVAGVCGDNQLIIPSLGPGLYTLALTDADFLPLAVDPGIAGPFDLTDTVSANYGSATGAYIDLSPGVFQTCVSLTDCNLDNGNFAVDILSYPDAPVPSPEPATAQFAGFAVAALALSIHYLKEKKS